jgi:hypothetical protein
MRGQYAPEKKAGIACAGVSPISFWACGQKKIRLQLCCRRTRAACSVVQAFGELVLALLSSIWVFVPPAGR